VVPTMPSNSPAPRLGASLSGVSSQHYQPEKRSSLLYAFFLIIVLLIGAFGGAYLYQPDLVKVRIDEARVALGLTSKAALQAASGPPFDPQAAGDILGRIALQASQCREPNGPQGKGRAQVLYEPTGVATSVAVSKPFHETSVGTCLLELFKTAEVPAFGGQPVIVTKTFDVR
jgi:hypothetical protein